MGNEGEIIAQEMLKNNTVVTRDHKGLDMKTTALKFPENQQIRYVVDTKLVLDRHYTDRQTGKQAGRQTHRQAGRQTEANKQLGNREEYLAEEAQTRGILWW